MYRKRKGIKDAKKYTVPYNPKTDDQGEQRDYLRNAVLAWQTDGYSVLDIEAWNRYAKTLKKGLSGYNVYTKLRINQLKKGKSWTKLIDCKTPGIYWDEIDVNIKIESEQLTVLYIGTSKSSILEKRTGFFSAGRYYFIITGLIKETRYYFYMINTETNEAARTGIYTIKTLKE